MNRIALAAFLVGVFIYQVAYGMTENVTNGNITASASAPPGTTIENLTITTPNTFLAPNMTGTWNFVTQPK